VPSTVRSITDEIAIEKKIERYHAILREKGVKIKNLRKRRLLSAYDTSGRPKSESSIDKLIEWAEHLDPNGHDILLPEFDNEEDNHEDP